MRISVVVPLYNAEAYIAQTLGSVLEQTRPPDEIIVVDDGSTDGSRKVAEQFEPTIRVVGHRSRSAPETRNHGASLATGQALMFLDADDVLGPDALEVLAEEVQAHPGCVAACPWYRLERVEGIWAKRPPSCRSRSPGEDPLQGWLRGWYHPPCSVLWSRAAYKRTGGWDPRARASNDDGDLMMRALATGVELRLTTRGSAFYRRLPDPTESLSGKRRTREGLLSRIGVIERIGTILEEKGDLSPYHSAFDDALDRVMRDGSRHPDLLERCAHLRRRLGDRGPRRRVRLAVRRARAVLHRAWRAVPPRPWTTPSPPPSLQEVRYGLGTASRTIGAPPEPEHA